MRKGTETGIALVASLFILVIIAILGLSFSFLASRDLHFAQRQERGTRALYLARAGVEYYIARGLPDSSGNGEARRISLSEDKTLYCDLQIKGTLLYSTGIMLNSSGEVVQRRTLVSPLWSLGKVYEIGAGEAQ